MASLIDYLVSTDAALSKNRGQDLSNEKESIANGLFRGNPILAAAGHAPAGYAGQVLYGNLFNQAYPGQGMGDLINNKNQADLKNVQATADLHNVNANINPTKIQPVDTRRQAIEELQNQGYTSTQAIDVAGRGHSVKVLNNKITPSEYYSSNPSVNGGLRGGNNMQPQPIQTQQQPQVNPQGEQAQVLSPQQPMIPQGQVPVGAAAILGNPNQVTPYVQSQQQKDIAEKQANQTGAKVVKDTLTSNQVNQGVAAKQLETSLSWVSNNLDNIAQYASGKGLVKKGSGWLGGFLDMPDSPEYKTYNTFKNNFVPQLASQFSSFYKTSIQPEVRKEMERKFIPLAGESSDMYKSRIANLIELLNAERMQAMQNPAQLIDTPPAWLGLPEGAGAVSASEEGAKDETPVNIVNDKGEKFNVPTWKINDYVGPGKQYKRAS